MGGLIETAAAIMTRADQRVAVAAQNIANITTPGFKAHHRFESLLAIDDPDMLSAPRWSSVGVADRLDTGVGKMISTSNPLDMAIEGSGYFVVRSGDALELTRSGQFSRDSEGRLATPDGAILQSTAGDCVVEREEFTVDAGGVIRSNGAEIGRLAIVDVADPARLEQTERGRFTAPRTAMREMNDPVVRQGMLESSNVSNTTEMLAIMSALRGSESGQRLVQVYDDLMARALNGFGQATS